MLVELGLLIPVICLLLIYMRRKLTRPANLPPGPPALPVLGNVHQMRKDLPATITKWHKQYGDTMTVYMGEQPLIVMNDFHTVKKVFSDDLTTGREQNNIVDFVTNRGLLMSQGEVWKEHRRFAISTLRDMGMGKSWLEDDILAEAEEMCNILKEASGKPIDPKILVSHSVSNVICSLVFGKRFSHSDEKFTRLTTLLAENIEIAGQDAPVLQIFPFLKYIPGHYQKRFSTLLQNLDEVKNFIGLLIKEHTSRDLSEDQGRDYIEASLMEAKKQAGTKSTFTDMQLFVSVLDLFLAGTETTSTTLLWSFIFMIENPHVMQKVQNEIDSVVGSDSVVRSDHRSRLAYTEATILEVQRCGNLVPLGLVHQALAEIKVDGYTVPRGAYITGNLLSMHMDSRYWDHPRRGK